MTCPRCQCPAALVGLARVDCVNKRCPCYYAPAREALDCLGPGESYSGESVFWIRRWLYEAEKEPLSED